MMKNRIKLLSALLIVIFSISLCTVPAFATDPSVDSQPVSVETDPIVTEPIVTEPSATEPPVTEAPVTTAPTTKATKPKTEPTTEEEVYTTRPPQNTTAVTYYTQATQQYNNNVYETTEATEAPTYATEAKRIDDDTLDDSDWEEIKNQLINADESNKSDSFDFIKKNTKNEDNGLWLLIVGILLILAGIGIIAFWIYYFVRKKRYLEERKNNSRGNGPRGNNPSRTAPNRVRRNYEDDYYQPTREVSHAERRQINKRSKFDTGEVEIPRSRYNQRPTRNGGSRGNRPTNGSRYRH